jgi:hypothetical protein
MLVNVGCLGYDTFAFVSECGCWICYVGPSLFLLRDSANKSGPLSGLSWLSEMHGRIGPDLKWNVKDQRIGMG